MTDKAKFEQKTVFRTDEAAGLVSDAAKRAYPALDQPSQTLTNYNGRESFQKDEPPAGELFDQQSQAQTSSERDGLASAEAARAYVDL